MLSRCGTRSLRTALALLVVAGTLTGQGRVWIVDAANGPGTDFLDLPPAIVAASNRDQIRVRPGLYTGATIVDKGLTILGGPGVQTHLSSPPLSITNLAAGRTVILAGIDHGQAGATLQITGNQGRVVLDRMGLGPVAVIDSHGVQCNGCALQGRGGVFLNPAVPALEATRATVVVSGCTVRGAGTFSPVRPSAGLVAISASVTIARSVVAGGAGGEIAPNQPGIVAADSSLWISGDAAAVVESGQTIGAAAAIIADRGTLTLDPNVTLRAFNSPAIVGSTPVVRTWLPSLRATGAAPAGTATADLFSPPGDLLVYFAGLPGAASDLGPIGVLWLDPVQFVITGFAVQAASGHTQTTTPVPNEPTLRFYAWSQQVLSGTLASGFRLSNPATFSFH